MKSTDLGCTSRSVTHKHLEEDLNLRLNFPKYKMGTRMPTLLVVLYVVLNTDKATGTWRHAINEAYNIDRVSLFINNINYNRIFTLVNSSGHLF